MNKQKAIDLLKTYPHSPDIKEYGYFMTYCLDSKKWHACYDSDKGGVWYYWDNNRFVQCKSLFDDAPKNHINYDRLCFIAKHSSRYGRVKL